MSDEQTAVEFDLGDVGESAEFGEVLDTDGVALVDAIGLLRLDVVPSFGGHVSFAMFSIGDVEPIRAYDCRNAPPEGIPHVAVIRADGVGRADAVPGRVVREREVSSDVVGRESVTAVTAFGLLARP